MIVYIDIDETICTHPEGDKDKPRDYSLAKPIVGNIRKANALYDAGHTVVYWTARGATSGIDHRELTEAQLDEWGAKRHELKLDKPFYDWFIDDRNINTKDWRHPL